MHKLTPSVSHDVVLRPAGVDDAGEILTLQYAAWLNEGRLHDSFDIPPLTETLEAVRTDLGRCTAIVGTTSRERIVGAVRAHSISPQTWYVGRLGVVPDLQGHGLGGRLLTEIERLAPPGATRVVLTTGPRSASNINFYERRGYVRIEPEDELGPQWLVHLAKPIEGES